MNGTWWRIPAVIALAIWALLAARPAAAQFNLNADVLQRIQQALPQQPAAKPKGQHKVLIFSKTNGFRHGSIPVGVTAVTLMGQQTGAYTAVHSEDEAMFEPDSLRQFDAVIMLNTTGEIFRPRQLPDDPQQRAAALQREERLKQSLVEFVRGGGGLAGMHSATDTYRNWKEYNDMMGGAFVSHPWHQKVPIRNLGPKHPLNEMFAGAGFEITDEIYQFRNDTARPSERRMLLALDTEKMDVSKGSREDGFYPVSWISTYGKGRTFYCSLGHRDEIYWNPLILRHYLAGIQYVLGDLDADATPQ